MANNGGHFWSIEAWCTSQTPHDDYDLHDGSSSSNALFLRQLNLSAIHPFCADPTTSYAEYEIPGIPRQGPLLNQDHLESWYDVLITIIAMGVPSLWGMLELWLRLFAYFLAPLGVTYLFYRQLVDVVPSCENDDVDTKDDKEVAAATSRSSRRHRLRLTLTCLFTILASIVLLTDTLYVHEFGGPQYGATWLLTSLYLSYKTITKYRLLQQSNYNGVPTHILMIGLMLALTGFLIYDPDAEYRVSFGGTAENQVNIDEGLYYNTNSPLARAVVNAWPERYYTYSSTSDGDDNGGAVATPWFPTGDSRTGLPFLLNKVPDPTFTRVWLPVHDGEVVALDITFPEMGHDPTQPLYLVLHGLNGGSQEEYVQDFCHRRNAENATVVVMVARGLMDLPVRGMDNFHGARWTDAHRAAQVLREAKEPKQLLAGVGYSMGAIILNNMVTRTGPECALDAAVSISGGLDMRYEIDFARAQRLWQPILTAELRDTFVVGKWGERVRSRLTKDQMKKLMRATHVSEIDQTAVVAYNGYRDLVHYYSDMSALGDVPYPSEEYNGDSLPSSRRIHNISIPLCVVHALDDPLVTWRTVAANNGLMHPTNLTNRLETEHLYLVLTSKGGHVGWPLGWLPHNLKWKWMSDISMGFVTAVAQARSSVANTDPSTRAGDHRA